MVQSNPGLLLMLARALDLSWITLKAILRVRAGPQGVSQAYLEQCLNSFNRITPETASKALQFMRLRERAAIASPGPTAYQ